MAEEQVGNLTALANTELAGTDEIVIRDVSITSGSQARRLSISELLVFLRGQNLGTGGQPAQAHNIYLAVGATEAQTVFTESDFKDGTRGTNISSGTDLTVPAYTGSRRIAIAIPSDHEISNIILDGLTQTGAFTKQAGTLTFTSPSETVEWWLSVYALRGDGSAGLGGDTITVHTRAD